MSKYPKLTYLLALMASANRLKLKKVIDWPDRSQSLDILETQADKLSSDEMEDFVDGDVSETERLTEKYNIKELSVFLNECFDGSFHKLVFQ